VSLCVCVSVCVCVCVCVCLCVCVSEREREKWSKMVNLALRLFEDKNIGRHKET